MHGRRLADAEYVLTTTGRTPVSGFSKMKRRLDEATGVADWRPHDFRRTLVTRLAEMKVGPHVADKILNHVEGAISDVALIYQRAQFLEERKRALELWAKHVGRVVEAKRQPVSPMPEAALRPEAAA